MDIRLNDRIRFFSELELEHLLSGDDKAGEVELEQAFVEFNLNDDLTQTAAPKSATLFEVHAQTRYKGWYARALYAQAQLSNLDLLNNTLGNGAAEQLKGYYVELGYNVFNKRLEESLTPFIRYEKYNTQETVSSNVTADPSKERTNMTIGVAYQPLDQITFKVDYTKKKNEAETGVDEFNAGIGYMF